MKNGKDYIIVIDCSEDGDKCFGIYSEEDFLADLEKDAKDGCDPPKFIMPDEQGEIDLDCVVGRIVIRGNVIEPKIVKTASRWAIA